MFRTSAFLAPLCLSATLVFGLTPALAERVDWKAVLPASKELPGFSEPSQRETAALYATLEASRPDGLAVQIRVNAYRDADEAAQCAHNASTHPWAGALASPVTGSPTGRRFAGREWHSLAANGRYRGSASFRMLQDRFVVSATFWFFRGDAKGTKQEKREISRPDLALVEDVANRILQRLQAVPTSAPAGPSLTWNERYGRKLPAAELLPGFREQPAPADAHHRENPASQGALRRTYYRERDGARLEIEIYQTFMNGTLRPHAEQAVARYGRAAPSGFSGLPLGEWVLCSAQPRRGDAVLATEDDHWLFLAHLTAGEPGQTIAISDLMLVESALRHVLAPPPPPPPVQLGIADFEMRYVVCGKGQGLMPTAHIAPVAPILRGAGLRVVVSKDIPVVRGWRGDHLVITIAAGAHELVVEGKHIPLGTEQHCALIDGEICAPITPVAVHIGLCTYLEGLNLEQGIFHVERVSAPRSGQVFGLALPQ